MIRVLELAARVGRRIPDWLKAGAKDAAIAGLKGAGTSLLGTLIDRALNPPKAPEVYRPRGEGESRSSPRGKKGAHIPRRRKVARP